MKGRGGAPPELLFCFPSRAHLALTPKLISSPAMPPDSTSRHRCRSGHQGKATSLFKSKPEKNTGGQIAGEPASPTVNCAGQIKVRRRPGSRRKQPMSTSSSRDFKGLMQFVDTLRNLRLDLQCFGSFRGARNCSIEEEEDEGGEAEDKARTVFSKWLMVLRETDSNGLKEEDDGKDREEQDRIIPPAATPPCNCLLLTRSSSAPAKGWVQGEEEEDEEEELGNEMMVLEEEDKVPMMSGGPDLLKMSTEIVKETWIVGNIEPLGRCRSWKR